MRSQFIYDVYDTLQGEMIVPVPGVENAFAEGTPCERLYAEATEAYERLRERLGVVDED